MIELNVTEVDIDKVRKDAEELFRNGGFYCSEAVVSSMRDNFDFPVGSELIAAASGFPVGVGRSKCLCGAVSGGVVAIGYVFGRTEPTSPKDPASAQTIELAGKLLEAFKESHRVTCCSILTRGMDMASGEHKDQCVRFTGEMAAKTAEIIAHAAHISIVSNGGAL